MHALDISDVWLAAVREVWSDDDRWCASEGALNRQLLRMYGSQPWRVRLGSTTASCYRTVAINGLFQFGHRQNHPTGLPQGQVMLSAANPLRLPVTMDVVPWQRGMPPGACPGAPGYRRSWDGGGLLHMRNGQSGALESLALIQDGGDFNLAATARRR